ncbi:sensor histidine kinase [Ramlibacter pallidus]|uniref:histidine kinase n=1 Tax=Ramlibacter pallidus TaxID=2780087 RepID=A0ABR9S3L6_9BURK|nr:ATP-binding protein [Ramlibacter pallidus]MBE7368109.1 response regulator [Ramlibacter pallidus]
MFVPAVEDSPPPPVLRNGRILLVDDAPSIHEDFRKILADQGPVDAEIDAREAAIFGLAPQRPGGFQLDSACQGEEALALVEAALASGRPYAMAFVDMRMPPGWDGVETIERLWRADPRLQVVICTAVSDHAWSEVLARLDVQDRLLIVKKPFDLIEVSQLAHTLTAKWCAAQQAAEQMRQLVDTVQRLRASETELRYTSRELESFAYSVAHDLRAPMAIIGSFGKLLAEHLEGHDGKPGHYLDRIIANANLGQEVLSGLLALTEIARAPLRLQTVDLSRIARQVMEELRHDAPGRAATVTIAPGLEAWADSRLMQCALRNLLENAWKFTSAREAADIEVGLASRTPLQDTFFVRDNGCGFDMAHADKLFHNFQRLHDAQEYPGTGVGLATVSRVLVRHGGHVWADSVPGQGSTFSFSLPRRPLAS